MIVKLTSYLTTAETNHGSDSGWPSEWFRLMLYIIINATNTLLFYMGKGSILKISQQMNHHKPTNHYGYGFCEYTNPAWGILDLCKQKLWPRVSWENKIFDLTVPTLYSNLQCKLKQGRTRKTSTWTKPKRPPPLREGPDKGCILKTETHRKPWKLSCWWNTLAIMCLIFFLFVCT